MLKIGHRGAAAHAPENTIISFQKAVELGADMVECDVRLTKDGHPVVIHDYQLGRLTNTFARVNRLTLAELRDLRVRETEGIPTLGEVITAVGPDAGINIELKVKGSVPVVMQTLRDHHVDWDNIMISSNHPKELRMAKELEPAVTTALIFRSTNSLNFWLVMDFLAIVFLPITKYYIAWVVQQAKADYLNINYRLLSREKVELFRKQGIKICAWTVNSQKKIDYFKSLGIDGIITNYPDRL